MTEYNPPKKVKSVGASKKRKRTAQHNRLDSTSHVPSNVWTTVTFRMQPDLVFQMDEVVNEEGMTKQEFFNDAVLEKIKRAKQARYKRMQRARKTNDSDSE